MAWERRGRSGATGFLLTAILAVAIGWLARSAIEQPRYSPPSQQRPQVVVITPPDAQVSSPPAAALQQSSSSFLNWLNGDRCAERDGRVRGGGNQNYTGGGAPLDVFGFLPKCEGGR
jgi:hypothetical protein